LIYLLEYIPCPRIRFDSFIRRYPKVLAVHRFEGQNEIVIAVPLQQRNYLFLVIVVVIVEINVDVDANGDE